MKRWLLLLTATLLWSPAAIAQIAFDGSSTSTASDGTAVTSVTFSHTVTSNTNGIILVSTSSQDSVSADRSVSSITYNGVALTSVVNATNGQLRSELWRLLAPATGANNVVVTMGGTCTSIIVSAISLTGVDQTTPVEASGTYNAADGTTTTAQVTLTTIADNAWIVDSFADADRFQTATMDALSNRTQRSNVFGNTGILDATSTRGPNTPAGNFTMSWTVSAAGTYPTMGAASLKPAVAAATPRRMALLGVGP